MHHNPLAQHATRWWVHVCVRVTTPQIWRPVSDRKANWQAQTHRSGESMGPARAYLLPMMKPNTMNTRMMVPATATTAMMMTGFCSLETIAADEMDTDTNTHTDGHSERQKCSVWTSTHQRLQYAGHNWAQWEAWRLITSPPLPSERVGEGRFYYYTHGSTVSESGLNSPRRRRQCPSSQTKTHSGWIVSHSELSRFSNCLRWQTADCSKEWVAVASYKVNASGVWGGEFMHFKSGGSVLYKWKRMIFLWPVSGGGGMENVATFDQLLLNQASLS